MNTCQVVLSVIIAVSAVEAAWTGDFANNQLGVLVQDTSEVAEVKRQHEAAYAQIYKLLPKLPVEEDKPQVPQFPQFPQPQFPQPQFPQFPQPQFPPQFPEAVTFPSLDLTSGAPWKGPFADHKLGQNVRETPEVEAARKHHELVFSKVRAILPELPPDEKTESDLHEAHPVAQFPQVVPHSQRHSVPLAEPADLEAARQAHLKAYEETAALLEHLRAFSPSTTPDPWSRHQRDYSGVAPAHAEHARAFAAALGV